MSPWARRFPNLANEGPVLGISATLRPLHVSARVVTREVPVMILITVVLLPVIWDEYIGRLEGILLVAMLPAYLGLHSSHLQGGGHGISGQVR